MRFEKKPENDFARFIDAYFEECAAACPRIEGIAGKWTFEDLIPGLSDFDTDDELYTCLTGDVPIQVLATATSKVDKKVYPMAFVLNPGKGRVFHCVLGHDVQALGESVGTLYRCGTAWAAGLPPGD